MEGDRFVGNYGVASLNHWKVQHPWTPNDIIQMRSDGHQAPFFAGAKATIPYYLGLKQNNAVIHPEPRSVMNETQKIMLMHGRF
jgi:hypothetical protein